MRSSMIRSYLDRIDQLSSLVKKLKIKENEGKVFIRRARNYEKLIIALRAEFLKCIGKPCPIRKKTAVKYLHMTTDDAKHLIKHGLTREEIKIECLREWSTAMKQR